MHEQTTISQPASVTPSSQVCSNNALHVGDIISTSEADTSPHIPEVSFMPRKNYSDDGGTLRLKPFASFIQQRSNTLLIQRQAAPATVPGSLFSANQKSRFRPTGNITRKEFDAYVMQNFGVIDVHTGTQQEQEQRSTRRGIPPVTITGWQSWDPGSVSGDYTSIIDGIENMASVIGAVPTITNITFFKVAYEPDATGAGIPDTSIGASFGAGNLTIFEAFSGSTNPAIGINTQQGAPTASPDRGRDVARTITHELGHGVAEAAMASQNNQTFVQFKAAVGWIGNPEVLYDIGQPTVRAAIANQTQLPSQHIITPSRWFDPTLSEQPVSRYAVDGGPSEDFAESIATFITNPSVLQQRSPARYNFIQSNIATWRTRMRPTMPARIRPPVGDFPIPSGDTRMA